MYNSHTFIVQDNYWLQQVGVATYITAYTHEGVVQDIQTVSHAHCNATTMSVLSHVTKPYSAAYAKCWFLRITLQTLRKDCHNMHMTMNMIRPGPHCYANQPPVVLVSRVSYRGGAPWDSLPFQLLL